MFSNKKSMYMKLFVVLMKFLSIFDFNRNKDYLDVIFKEND